MSCKHDAYGRLPEYLVEEKMIRAREEYEERQAVENGVVPDGMVVMKEEDRLKTLATLKVNADQAKLDLSKAPLLIETQGQRRRVKDMEDKLKQVEEAIEIFSKPRVYIYEE